MNFYIRTNFSNKLGIGHIIRTIRLSRRLNRLGHTCFFFLDKSIVNNFSFMKGINAKKLYRNNKSFKSETEDAKLFIGSTKKFSRGNVIVDDYRLAYQWEKLVRKHQFPNNILCRRRWKFISYRKNNKLLTAHDRCLKTKYIFYSNDRSVNKKQK